MQTLHPSFSFSKVFTESLASPANVADKIGEKGMDLSKIVGTHILDKIDDMIPDEEQAVKRSDDMFKLVQHAVSKAATNVPMS